MITHGAWSLPAEVKEDTEVLSSVLWPAVAAAAVINVAGNGCEPGRGALRMAGRPLAAACPGGDVPLVVRH